MRALSLISFEVLKLSDGRENVSSDSDRMYHDGCRVRGALPAIVYFSFHFLNELQQTIPSVYIFDMDENGGMRLIEDDVERREFYPGDEFPLVLRQHSSGVKR